MKKFKPVTRPVHVDFFSITEIKGVKHIHLHGYTYKSDDYWANMEACGLLIPLSEFVRDFSADTEGNYVDSLYEQCKQYQGDYTEKEIVEVINHYYSRIVFSAARRDGEGMPDAYLDFGELTEDTPEGEYLTTPDREPIEL